MSYAYLLNLLSSKDVLAYQALLMLSCYLLVAGGVFGRRKIIRSEATAPWWLKLSTVAVIISTSLIPAIYRLLPVDTLILPWECESAFLYYFGLSLKESVSDYALKSIFDNPGVLSASGKSLLYGVPTYALMNKIGWSVFTLRIVAFLFGLLLLIPGYFLAARLFNRSVGLIFVMLLAANTHTIYYMGYGVSSTATLFGLLLALALCVATLQVRWFHRYVLALLAAIALFASCFNYSPAKIFVVITLACLGLYSFVSLWRWKERGQSGLAAFLTVVVTLGLFTAERHLNPGADFASARGEQALIFMNYKGDLINYLGDTPDIQAIDPATMPLSVKLRFLSAVAKRRLPELIRAYDPIEAIKFVYPQGSFDGTSMLTYPIGLWVVLIVGFIGTIASLQTFRSFFILSLLFGGLTTLLLTTRFDTHRAYIIIVPVSMMIAYGIWIPLRRLRGGFLRETHCVLLAFAFTAALIANSWFFMAKRDYQHRNVWEYARAAERHVQPHTTIAMSLECTSRALVILNVAETARTNPQPGLNLWDPSLGEHLIDHMFNPNSEVYQRFLNDAQKGKAVLLYGGSVSRVLEDLKTKPFEVMNTVDEGGGTLIVTPRNPVSTQ